MFSLYLTSFVYFCCEENYKNYVTVNHQQTTSFNAHSLLFCLSTCFNVSNDETRWVSYPITHATLLETCLSCDFPPLHLVGLLIRRLVKMPSDSDQKPSYDAGERHDSTPPPEIAIKMSQLHKQASGKPDSHDCEDEELSSDESTTSDGNRDKHNVQSQTTTVANISSLRVARSAKMTTQTPFANYRQIRVISSPTRSYKRHGSKRGAVIIPPYYFCVSVAKVCI
jgi:hypothetical protein